MANEAAAMQSQLDNAYQWKEKLEQDLAKANEDCESLSQSIKDQQDVYANLESQKVQDLRSHQEQIAQIEAARKDLQQRLARAAAEMTSHLNPLQESPPSTPQPGAHAKAVPCIAAPGIPQPPPGRSMESPTENCLHPRTTRSSTVELTSM